MGKFYEGLYEALSVYVRHSAWLSAVPERPKNDRSEAPLLSRLERLRQDRKDEDYRPDMPPIDVGGHVIGYLFEVGPSMVVGMGPGPVTHEELRAWQGNTGIELQPWEVRFLRRLSFDYLAELRKAEKPDCPPPWRADDYVPDIKRVTKSVQASIMELAKL